MPRLIFIAYILLGLLEIIGEFFGIRTLVLIIKPLLMPVLCVWHFSVAKGAWNKVHALVIAGFIFSWGGDVSLMFAKADSPPIFFLAGLSSFLLAHVLYVVAFTRKDFMADGKSVLLQKPLLVVPYILYGLALLSFIMPHMLSDHQDKLVPVIVYTIVIMTMVITAFNRYAKVNKNSFLLVFLGAVLFMFSDSCIALNRFTDFFDGNKEIARLIIMALYITAQMLISVGILKQFDLISGDKDGIGK